MSTLIDAGEQRALEALARSWQGRPTFGPIVVDGGANRGDYAAAVLEHFPDPRIFCFEPQASAFNALDDRLGGDSRVRLFRCGLSSVSGTATLRSSVHEACVLATLTDRDSDVCDESVKLPVQERVRLYPLDEALAGLTNRIDLLKLDLEGHELHALRGALGWLERGPIVQFEFHACALAAGVSFLDIWNLLREYGFTVYRLQPNGDVWLVPEYHEREEAPLPGRNYLAVPRDNRWFAFERPE